MEAGGACSDRGLAGNWEEGTNTAAHPAPRETPAEKGSAQWSELLPVSQDVRLSTGLQFPASTCPVCLHKKHIFTNVFY